MSNDLIASMPVSAKEVEDANATWTALANLVTDDNNPVVTLPAGDPLINGLELLTALNAATVADGENGSKVVTLVTETAAATPAPKTAVKEAAAAPSSFASEDGEERREETLR